MGVSTARVMRVRLPCRTHTVIGARGMPIDPVEEYLRFLREDQASPHTV